MTLNTPGGSVWPARFAYAAAGLFTLASAGTNLVYGWSKGTDTASALVWAVVSLAVSIVFALSWPAVIISADRKQWSRASMAFVALLLCGTYSVSAALGSAMGGRANAAIEQKDISDKRAKAQASYDTATMELMALKPSRPVAEVEALVESARPQCRIVVTLNRRDTVCAKPAALTAELGRAKRRAELEQKIELARTELASIQPVRVANSDAKALTRYLNALGVEVSPDRLNDLLVLLAVVVIEAGGGLALAVGMALGEGTRSGRSERAIGQGERSVSERPNKPLNANPERSPETANATKPLDRSPALNERANRSAHDRVLEMLRQKDGVLFGGQGALGASFGWSKTRMNEVLHELQAAGRVRLSVSRQGTAVRLISGTA